MPLRLLTAPSPLPERGGKPLLNQGKTLTQTGACWREASECGTGALSRLNERSLTSSFGPTVRTGSGGRCADLPIRSSLPEVSICNRVDQRNIP